MIKLRAKLLLAMVPVIFGMSATAANAACPQRLGIGHGDTVESIAQTCKITVQRLKNANPGLNVSGLQAGTFVVVPRPVLPSQQLTVGRPSIRVAPPLVPPATGISPSKTVIAPPLPPVVHRFELPGLAGQPERFTVNPHQRP